MRLGECLVGPDESVTLHLHIVGKLRGELAFSLSQPPSLSSLSSFFSPPTVCSCKSVHCFLCFPLSLPPPPSPSPAPNPSFFLSKYLLQCSHASVALSPSTSISCHSATPRSLSLVSSRKTTTGGGPHSEVIGGSPEPQWNQKSEQGCSNRMMVVICTLASFINDKFWGVAPDNADPWFAMRLEYAMPSSSFFSLF